MITQNDQLIVPSFYLFIDDTITRFGQAYHDDTQVFTYSDTNDRPQGFLSYFSEDRQFLTNKEDVPNYVWINGVKVYQNFDEEQKLLIDYDKGRILVSDNVGTSATISGDFPTKEVNIYLTNQTQEQLLINSEFNVSGDAYLKTTGGMGERRYTIPAVFLSNNSSDNKPFAFGGMEDSSYQITATIISDNLYEAEATSSLLRDCSSRSFKKIPFEAFPYGAFGSLKSHPYTYTGLVNSSGYDCVFIEKAKSYRYSDSLASKISKDLYISAVEFTISDPRMPRSQFS